MELSTKSKYGIRALIDLGINAKEKSVSIKSIANRNDISEGYLEQIIAILKTSKIVASTRGAYGGYKLAREPKEISLKEILIALEGNLDISACASKENPCNNELCHLNLVWKKVSDGLKEITANIYLNELINEQVRKEVIK